MFKKIFNRKPFKPQFRIVLSEYGGFIIESTDNKKRKYKLDTNIYNNNTYGFGNLDEAKKKLESYKEQLAIKSKAGTVVYSDDIPVAEKNVNKLLKKLGL